MKKNISNIRRVIPRADSFLPIVATMAFLLPELAQAQVTLPFTDPFAYTEGSALGGTGGGNTVWTLGNSIGSGGMTNRAAAALSYPGLASSTGLGVIMPVGGSSGRVKGVQFNSGTFTASNPTLYASFLLNIQTAPTGVKLLCYLRASTGGGTPHAGLFVTSTNTLLLSKNSTTPAATVTPALAAGTHLVVLRYKWVSSATTDDEVALWVDPGSLGAAENAVPGSTISTSSGTDQSSLVNFSFSQASGDTGVYWLDEIRIATNWAGVTPNGCTPPTQYALTGGGAYCSGGSGVSVGLANSDSGIDYQLKLNGSPVGSAVAGTGAVLDFGLQTAAGTYTVAGSNTATACVGPMSGNAVVTVNTAPAITGGASNVTACVGATANFTVSATGAGLTYQWQVDTGSGFGNVTTGTGGTTASYTTATLSGADNNSQFHCLVSGTCSPSVTSSTGTLTVSSGASVDSNPTDKTVSTGSTATFTVSASGPGLGYQWQFSTNNGTTYNNVGSGSGGTTASYTTAALATSDSGTKYKCVVSAACGSPAESTVATLTVFDAIYRTAASGVWTLPATWEQSYDGGANWVAGTTYPTAANTTNIAVRNSHTVTVTNALSVDDLNIASGGEVDASGALLTINDGTAALDCDVSGTILVASAAGSGFTNAGGGLTFESGGHFVWNGASTIAVPTATWADGSLCEVQNGTTTTPSGLGQSFYDFYWNKTSSGQVNLGGTLTTIRHDLRMRGSSAADNSVRFMAVTSTVDMHVGHDVILEGGYTTLSGGSQINTVLNIHVGNNFLINSGATLDSRTSGGGSSANILFTNSSTAQNFTNAGGITHSGTGGGCPINWKVLGGVTLNLGAGNIVLGTANNSTRDSVTVDGTLNFGTSQLTGAGTLTVNDTGTLVGNGTNQLTVGMNANNYGGTLNLPGLPGTLNNGDNFQLFDATSYSGSFTNIVPATTPVTGLSWDTSLLASNGRLYAGSAVTTPFKITYSELTGGSLILRGSGGTASGTFAIVTTNNVSEPLSNWPTWTTGNFDGSGNFDVTNPVPVATPAFFRVRQP